MPYEIKTEIQPSPRQDAQQICPKCDLQSSSGLGRSSSLDALSGVFFHVYLQIVERSRCGLTFASNRTMYVRSRRTISRSPDVKTFIARSCFVRIHTHPDQMYTTHALCKTRTHRIISHNEASSPFSSRLLLYCATATSSAYTLTNPEEWLQVSQCGLSANQIRDRSREFRRTSLIGPHLGLESTN